MDVKYSFVIPHKNSLNLLQRCVNSIPIRADVEIVIVDDNSKDDQIPHFDQDNIKLVCLSKDETNGAGHARNVGLTEVKGEWILFPDCDDYYVEGFLDKLASYNAHDIDVVYFNSIYKDGKTGEQLPSMRFSSYFENYDGTRDSTDAVKFRHNSPWTKMISRAYILRHGIHFEEAVNGNDMFFSMSVGYNTNRIDVIKQPLYVYLRNSNSITKKKLTTKEVFCVFNHTVQLNNFFKFIGHEAWKLSLSAMCLYYIKKCGLPFVTYLIRKIPYVYKHKKDLVLFVSSKV